jgi:hypothetical protein
MAIGQPGVGKTDFALQHHPLLTGSTRESDIEKVPVPAGPGAAVDRRDHRTDVVFLSAATLIERPLPTNLASTMRMMQRDDGHGAGSRVVAKQLAHARLGWRGCDRAVPFGQGRTRRRLPSVPRGPGCEPGPLSAQRRDAASLSHKASVNQAAMPSRPRVNVDAVLGHVVE